MPKLFSSSNKKFLSQVEKPERELNKFISDNWRDLFPNYTFVASEFPLKGNVRSLGTNGKIDILAYNPASKKFVIFELKKDYDKNITDQVADYRDYVQDNFSNVYLLTTQKYDVALPKYTEVNAAAVEIILIAKKFSLTQLDRVKKNKENNITLIKYYWFEDDLIFIDYVNNDPDDIKIEAANAKKISEIKNIIEQDPELRETERFFGLLVAGKEVFLPFLAFTKTKGQVALDFKQTRIRLTVGRASFSIVRCGGRGGRKAILQINTDFDATPLRNNGLEIDDRFRGEGVKKKGSLGLERYEVFLRDEKEVKTLCDFLQDKI
jgi:hypothetical protein